MIEELESQMNEARARAVEAQALFSEAQTKLIEAQAEEKIRQLDQASSKEFDLSYLDEKEEDLSWFQKQILPGLIGMAIAFFIVLIFVMGRLF